MLFEDYFSNQFRRISYMTMFHNVHPLKHRIVYQIIKFLFRWTVVLELKNLLDWRQRCVHFLSMTVENIKNQRVWITISYNEYRDILLTNRCLRHLMNRIQSKAYIIGTYEINKNSWSFFDDKIYIQKMDMMD